MTKLPCCYLATSDNSRGLYGVPSLTYGPTRVSTQCHHFPREAPRLGSSFHTFTNAKIGYIGCRFSLYALALVEGMKLGQPAGRFSSWTCSALCFSRGAYNLARDPPPTTSLESPKLVGIKETSFHGKTFHLTGHSWSDLVSARVASLHNHDTSLPLFEAMVELDSASG